MKPGACPRPAGRIGIRDLEAALWHKAACSGDAALMKAAGTHRLQWVCVGWILVGEVSQLE
jgi:hypothetical protein